MRILCFECSGYEPRRDGPDAIPGLLHLLTITWRFSIVEQIQSKGVLMEKKRKLILIIAVVGMIGTFLPWASAFGFTVSGTEGDGWITLVLFAIGGAMALFSGDRGQALGSGKLLAVWIPAALAAIIALRKIFTKPAGISIGIGLWLIAIAGIIQVVHVLFLKGSAVEKTTYAPPSPPAPEPSPEPAPEPPAPEPEEKEEEEKE